MDILTFRTKIEAELYERDYNNDDIDNFWMRDRHTQNSDGETILEYIYKMMSK